MDPLLLLLAKQQSLSLRRCISLLCCMFPIYLVTGFMLVHSLRLWIALSLSLPHRVFQDLNTRQVIGDGREVGGLYLFDLWMSASNAYSTFSSLDVWLWHCRLGHPSNFVLKIFPSYLLVILSVTINERASTLFSPLHSDVWQCPSVSRTGYRYFVTFIDHCSRMTWIDMMKNKSEVFDHFCMFYRL